MKPYPFVRAGITFLKSAFLLILAGCQGAGSMLVQVDVYKGPLAKTKTVQLGELAAVFDEGNALLEIFVKNANALMKNLCEPTRPQAGAVECQQLADAIRRAGKIKQQFSSAFAGNVNKALPELFQAAGVITRSDRSRLTDAALEAYDDAASKIDDATFEFTRIATQLKVEAFYWAELHIAQIPTHPAIRSLMVGYVNLASELSNQMASRTDAIAKQLDKKLEGSELALSDHLKDAGPTDFLHLYEWYDATLPDPLSTGPNRLTPQDRARLAKRLFSDHYWTTINQVHASGQGEVRMALIKDDIGNWNLKSFDSDPEKLLNAYRELALAGIEAGIRVGKALGTGGGAAGLELASQFARGRLGSTQTAALGAGRIDNLRARARAELEALKADAAKSDVDLEAAEKAAQKDFDTKQSEAKTKSSAYKAATDARIKAEQDLAILRQGGASTEALTKGENGLDDKFRQEENRRLEFAQAQAAEQGARSALDNGQKKRRDVMSAIFGEAKKALEIHRRVIDGLKEIQGAQP